MYEVVVVISRVAPSRTLWKHGSKNSCLSKVGEQQQQQQQSAIKQKQKQQQKQQHVRTLPLISNSLSSRISSQFLSSRPRYSQLYTHRPFSVFHFSLSFTYLSFSVPVFQIFHILLLLSITFS